MNGGNVRSLYHAELGRSVLLGAHGLDFLGVDCCFFPWDPLAPHFWMTTTAKPHLADGQSRVPDAFGRSQGLFWGLHAMKLPPSHSRFLKFELMKSRLQEEHVAPALGYFRQPAQPCSNRRGCQTLHLRLFATVSQQPDPIASPK